MSAPDTLPASASVESEYPQSKPGFNKFGDSTAGIKGGAREGAGPKPLPDDMRMQSEKINALPRDWEYLQLFLPADVEPKQRTASHLFRAAVQHLRLFAPHGPDKPFYTRDPAMPAKPRTTPAVAREAAQRGITKAELINEMYQLYKAEKDKAQKAREE